MKNPYLQNSSLLQRGYGDYVWNIEPYGKDLYQESMIYLTGGQVRGYGHIWMQCLEDH